MAIELEMLESRVLLSGNAPFEPELVARRGGLPLAIADFNGDSRPDLLLQRAGRLVVRLNDGAGAFGATADAIELPIVLPNNFDAHGRVAVGRFTSGDEIDVVVATGLGPNARLTLLKNDGSAGFTRAGSPLIPAGPGRSATIEAGMFDGDGAEARAAVVISNGATLREIRFGDHGRVRASNVIFAHRGRIDSFAIGDADGDGRDDAAVACSAPTDAPQVRLTTLRALISVDDGEGSHAFGSMVVARMGSGVVGRIELADSTGDGLADVVTTMSGVGGQQHLQLALHASVVDEAGVTFAEQVTLFDFLRDPPDNVFDYLTLIGVGDFNGDGRQDVAYDYASVYNGRMTPWNASAVVLEGDGEGGFVSSGIPSELFGYEFALSWRGFAFVDVAGDGMPDLLKLNMFGGSLLMQRRYPADWTQPPVIGSLDVSEITLPSGKRRISATGVSDPDGMVCGVRFRFDSGDSADTYWVMSDLDGSDGWSVQLRADSYYGPPGVKRFWAQAWDEFGFWSEEVMVEVTFA